MAALLNLTHQLYAFKQLSETDRAFTLLGLKLPLEQADREFS